MRSQANRQFVLAAAVPSGMRSPATAAISV